MTDSLQDAAPLRQVQCEACQGEGRTYHGVHGGNDPDEYSVTCRWCSGDGWTVEEVEADEECVRCGTPLETGPWGFTYCPQCNPNPARE